MEVISDFSVDEKFFEFGYVITGDHKKSLSLLAPKDNVDLWWPNGMGEHPLYTFELSLHGNTSDGKSFQTSVVRKQIGL